MLNRTIRIHSGCTRKHFLKSIYDVTIDSLFTPSLIDAVAVIDADSAEKCCDVGFVAVDCVVFVAVDELDFVPESDLAVAEHFERQSGFGFAGSIQL